jgi:pimeloyl-ACP methyl ester carboxylesterase/6-phosphogluconolactonase/glucosamine-6-phosphate isomerase/deaminase
MPTTSFKPAKKNSGLKKAVLSIGIPETLYFLNKEAFDEAVGREFIRFANELTDAGKQCFVGLSHGKSPAGAYAYILEHYHELRKPDQILYTFVNAPLDRQRSLEGVTDARFFIRRLFRTGRVSREQVIGYQFKRESLEAYVEDFNRSVSEYLKQQKKDGLDFVFLASDPSGRVAAIDRHSAAFGSKEIAVIVHCGTDTELTATPHFLLRSSRIAFLATKADKRRPLAWLYAVKPEAAESPGFLRYLPEIEKRMTVFIDDHALTWPQIEVSRKTPYGNTTIRIDTANPYRADAEQKLPVVILIHGFLGLNSYDGLLANIPSHKYIAAAMHYGSIPNDLPPDEYSHHLARNIEAVVEFFGKNGHPVYLFDHSMGNIYFMMIDRELPKFPGIRKYLRGRIGANPFFGEESKHAIIGFLDNVILPALSLIKGPFSKGMLLTLRSLIPLDPKWMVRKRGINLSDWLIRKESGMRDRIWAAAKDRILYLMTNMDSLPHLNRIPIERALNRLPAKVFAIQTHSALQQSIVFDKQRGLHHMPAANIPVLILKSERDGVAKYVDRIYQGEGIEIMDVTNIQEKDLFREHLYHMIEPLKTTEIIDQFISKTELAAIRRSVE